MLERLLRLVAVLFQGVVYSVITPAVAAGLGALVAAACRPEKVFLGAEIGGVVGALLVVGGLRAVFGAPMGVGGFISWWVKEIATPLAAIGVGVWSYFPLIPLITGKALLGLRFDSELASFASGLAALFVVFPIALSLAEIITSQETQDFLATRVISGGVQTFRETLRRAKALGGHRPFGPPGGEK